MPRILLDQVSKEYRLGQQGSLRAAVSGLAARVARRQRALEDHDSLWAVRDVSFEIQGGDALGIIGPNGAGKSTVLKMISGITPPTRGRIEIEGRVAALIELGAGFHPELTGRENIYLNGAILGLSRAEIARKFDEIVSFSELEAFIDVPVKRYSSGMYARLAFSTAAHVDADILLVDEVLSVGDLAFQHKCLRVMQQFQQENKAVVFVSHNTFAVQSLCNRALLLAQGRIVADGAPDQIVQSYEAHLGELARAKVAGPTDTPSTRPPVVLTHVSLHDPATGAAVEHIEVGAALNVRIAYHANVPVERPLFHFIIKRADGVVCCGANAGCDGLQPGTIKGPGTIEAALPSLTLPPAEYFVVAFVSNEQHTIDYAMGMSRTFRVLPYPFLDARIGGYALRAVWKKEP